MMPGNYTAADFPIGEYREADSMKTSELGRQFIERFEGLFLWSYDDANDHVVRAGGHARGTLTIGYGHTNDAGPPKVYAGMVIDRPTADRILAADLASVEIEVEHHVRVVLNQFQFDALVSFQFNTGWLTHAQCSLLKALNSGNYILADEDFSLYDEASGHRVWGLEVRRKAEARLFKDGVYGSNA